jgi:mRNA interferase MazF
VPQFDELIGTGDADLEASGLKKATVIRIGRLAVVEQGLLVGELGAISDQRLQRVRRRIAEWVLREQGIAK